jgi:arabinan endo-1,5-alpha-L-arabinosidase
MKLLVTTAAILALALPALALDGQVGIHDPSTVVQCEGKYYTFGTGGTTLVSDDGWIWRRGVTPSRTGMAPDVIQIGNRYFMYIARNVGAQPRADVNLIWNQTLDADSPNYKWEEGGATDFCARFLDKDDKPLTEWTVNLNEVK